jgi:REP element-mobilizing transposase RayT
MAEGVIWRDARSCVSARQSRRFRRAETHGSAFQRQPSYKMELSDFGKIVEQELFKSFEIRQELILHEYVIMPNHIHAIVEINNTDIAVETHGRASLHVENDDHDEMHGRASLHVENDDIGDIGDIGDYADTHGRAYLHDNHDDIVDYAEMHGRAFRYDDIDVYAETHDRASLQAEPLNRR